MSIPLSAFPELTAAEADAATGDSRKVVWSIINHFCDVYTNLATADKPSKMVLNKYYGNVDPATGNFVAGYNFTFFLSATGLDVADE